MDVRGPQVVPARSVGPGRSGSITSNQFERRGEAGGTVDPRGIMKLVTAYLLSRLEEPRVTRRLRTAVAHGQTARHRRSTWQQTGHRVFIPLAIDDGLGQVHEAAAFRVDRHPPDMTLVQGCEQRSIPGEFRGIKLWKSAAEHH